MRHRDNNRVQLDELEVRIRASQSGEPAVLVAGEAGVLMRRDAFSFDVWLDRSCSLQAESGGNEDSAEVG